MKKFIISFAFILFFAFGINVQAADGYIDIDPAQPTETGDAVEVVEVFWYGCPHCFDFEPIITKWISEMPEGVKFRRMPGIFRKSWIPHAKAYYTAEKLGVVDKIHSPLFDAIHKERKEIFDDESIRDFFIEHGVDAAEFDKVYNSDEVNTKIKQAYVMGQRYKITGVPAVIVNGKYMVGAGTAGDPEGVIKVMNQLVEKEKAVK